MPVPGKLRLILAAVVAVVGIGLLAVAIPPLVTPGDAKQPLTSGGRLVPGQDYLLYDTSHPYYPRTYPRLVCVLMHSNKPVAELRIDPSEPRYGAPHGAYIGRFRVDQRVDGYVECTTVGSVAFRSS